MSGSNMSLLDLYGITYAPLSNDTEIEEVKDLKKNSPEDLTTDFVVDELAYVADITSLGLKGFSELISSANESRDELSTGSGLLCLTGFIKRCEYLLHLLGEATAEAAGNYGDALTTLKEYEELVKGGNRPEYEDVKRVVNLTPNMRWSSPEGVKDSKGKVGFKPKTIVFGGAGGAKGEGEVKDEPSGAKTRTSRRHPTGFAKFTFKPEDLLDDDSDDGGSTSISRSRVDSDDQRSVSTAGNQSRKSEDEDIGDVNPFQNGGQRSSSVGFNNTTIDVVNDTGADPNWADEKRHEKRFSRIRERIPTGHPRVMRAASDELSGLLEEYEKQMTGMEDDEMTLENTAVNRGELIDSDDDKVDDSNKKQSSGGGGGGVRF